MGWNAIFAEATGHMVRLTLEAYEVDREVRHFVATMGGPRKWRQMHRAERRRLRMSLPAHHRV